MSKNKLQTPIECECSCSTFYIEILDHESFDMMHQRMVNVVEGILFQCTECGYVGTAWRD